MFTGIVEEISGIPSPSPHPQSLLTIPSGHHPRPPRRHKRHLPDHRPPSNLPPPLRRPPRRHHRHQPRLPHPHLLHPHPTPPRHPPRAPPPPQPPPPPP